MVTALRAVAGYRGEAAFATWSMKIAARLYLQPPAKEARFVLMAEPIEPTHAGPVRSLQHARLDLDRALAQLSRARAPLRLAVPRGRPDAGRDRRRLSMPLGTVKSHVTSGLKKLRVLMMTAE